MMFYFAWEQAINQKTFHLPKTKQFSTFFFFKKNSIFFKIKIFTKKGKQTWQRSLKREHDSKWALRYKKKCAKIMELNSLLEYGKKVWVA